MSAGTKYVGKVTGDRVTHWRVQVQNVRTGKVWESWWAVGGEPPTDAEIVEAWDNDTHAGRVASKNWRVV